MADDEDLYKGPLAERVQSKNWKVRRAAFEELQQKFKEATDNAILYEYGTYHTSSRHRITSRAPHLARSVVVLIWRPFRVSTCSAQIQEDNRRQERSGPGEGTRGPSHLDRQSREPHKV